VPNEPVGYELQPFEKRLAALETAAARQPAHLAFASSVNGVRTHQFYFDRFWRLIGAPPSTELRSYAREVNDGNRAAAHNYLTHGLHSYKGKFFPQIVRALINHAQLEPGSSVVDPFIGSGTTAVEAELMGYAGYGIDRNPLAALIADTKCAALHLELDEVLEAHEEVLGRVRTSRATSIANRSYLERWFPPDTLLLIARTLAGINHAPVPEAFKNVARLVLSTNLRAWSLQEPSQLRIFRRAEAPPAADLAARFASDLRSAHAELCVSLRLIRELELVLPGATIILGDGRLLESWAGSHDALITSPPYATALPYIDTDRLSIYALGLADISDRSSLEWAMIGNREIRQRQKTELEQALVANEAELPEDVCASILQIRRANARAEVGFRRANLPALLYKYFWDMDTVLRRAADHLQPNTLCAIVVGDSFTVAGDKRVRIATGDHIVSCAEAQGFRLEERIAMGGQVRYLPHQKNTIPAEEILLLRRA
jgi:site-specific DNA-methyltransferase (cytosine-N4-specific)